MQAEGGVSRRDILSGLAGAAVVAAPAIANADVEYPNVPFLGGSDTVQISACVMTPRVTPLTPSKGIADSVTSYYPVR